ncbi:arginase family protein [Luethyella okanaganae]|uniref:Arginase family protein n=1 Tax=Luethyella okanaganae TaxID=69372 RepID=A0ABW1VDZ3_9MICO
MTTTLTHFAGRAGDHNDRAMAASPVLAAVLGERLGLQPIVIGEPSPSSPMDWVAELAEAGPALQSMALHYDAQLGNRVTPVAAISRCAVALATLPVVARHRPDAVVVWLDAHADLNTPDSTETGYLGGLALSGPLGLWASGLGEGLSDNNTILVGVRDIDPFELQLLEEGRVELVRVGPGMAEELRRAVAGRPVYVHIDCDVLDPGIVPTDYSIANGMTLAQLQACAQVLAQSEVVGLEIGELESSVLNQSSSRQDAQLITGALEALIQSIEHKDPRT